MGNIKNEMNSLERTVGIMEIQRILNHEGIDEVDEMDYCSECKELDVIYKSGVCFKCYKRVCEEYQDDEKRQDYNCKL